MKKNLLLPLLLLITAVIIPSCSDDSSISLPTPPEKIKYKGELLVNNIFTVNNATCEITLDESTGTLKLEMFNIKFAENMPIEITLSTSGINYSTTNNKTIFSGENIIPFMGVIPMPNYTFSNITGYIENSKLNFNVTLTKGVFIFNGEEIIE